MGQVYKFHVTVGDDSDVMLKHNSVPPAEITVTI